jgi:hypothetical protein
MSEKISAMPNAALPLTGAELVPLVQGGANVKATTRNVCPLQEVVTAADFNQTNVGALANITGLTFNLTAGKKYAFRAVLFCNIDIATGGNTGIKIAISGTATATKIIFCGTLGDVTGGATLYGRAAALNTAIFTGSAVFTPQAADIAIEGYIHVNAAGTLTIQTCQDAPAPGLINTILEGSSFSLFEIQ